MTQEDKLIKIIIVIGTVRPGNYTQRAAVIVADKLNELEDVDLETLDLADYRLNNPGIRGENDADKLQSKLLESGGVVICMPEYNGSFPAALKLMIENSGFPSALSQKPVALLGVAAGKIGAIKSLEHLRSVLCHIGALTLPRAVSVPEVNKVFTKSGECLDESIQKRIGQLSMDLYKQTKCSFLCSVRDEEEEARQK